MITNSEEQTVLLRRYVTNQKVVNPSITAIQAETRGGIESVRSPMTCERSCHNFTIGQLIQQYSGTAAVAFQAYPRRALLARGLVAWHSMGVHHIFEDIVGMVAQYVDERCLADKLQLDELTAYTLRL